MKSRWSFKEDRRLIELATSSKSLDEIAHLMGRSLDGTRKAAVRLGIRLSERSSPGRTGRITWAQVGRVTDPGRYKFTLGWLTITAEDLAIWERCPAAAFTLLPKGAFESGGEFALGSFDPMPRERTIP
jgi:hypothetical protein